MTAAPEKPAERSVRTCWGSVAPPPRLEGREEALAYLEGPFHDLLEALHACRQAGTHEPALLAFDLVMQAGELACAIREDGVLEGDFYSPPSEAASELSRALRELLERHEKAEGEELDDPDVALRGLSRALDVATAAARREEERGAA